MNNPKQYQVDDIVFINVQVQSKKATHTVKRLAYIRRGPCKIITSYPSGLYELQAISNPQAAMIKKHGSDLYLSPENLIPFAPMESSDQLFADLNKEMSKQPYKLAGLEGYQPAQPWAQPIASAQMSKLDLQENLPFPSLLAKMDNDFDNWPDEVNPFLHKEPPQTPEIQIPSQPILITTAIPLRTVQKMVADIIQSEDTLFFINHSVTATEGRKEWKLIQVNFEKSI
jgi:hypothetical protein